METITFDEFTGRFGNTPRRQELLDALRTELDNLAVIGATHRLYVFGSFVNEPDKAEPGDLDLLLSGFGPSAMSGSYEQVTNKAELQILVDWRLWSFSDTGPRKPVLATAEEMVAKFNTQPANLASGICIDVEQLAEIAG